MPPVHCPTTTALETLGFPAAGESFQPGTRTEWALILLGTPWARAAMQVHLHCLTQRHQLYLAMQGDIQQHHQLTMRSVLKANHVFWAWEKKSFLIENHEHRQNFKI